MATYPELYSLSSDAALLQRVEVAVLVSAYGYLADPNARNDQIAWAANTLATPAATAVQALKTVLAAFRSMTVAQITGASDTALQSAIDTIVPGLIAGRAR